MGRTPELGYPVKQRLTIEPLGSRPRIPTSFMSRRTRASNFQQIRIYDIGSEPGKRNRPLHRPRQISSMLAAKYDLDVRATLGRSPTSSKVPRARPSLSTTIGRRFNGARKTIPPETMSSSRPATRGLGAPIVAVSRSASPAGLLRSSERQRAKASRQIPPGDEFGRRSATRNLSPTKRATECMIPGLLTLPASYDKHRHGRIPLVVLPHGGPWARDYLGWDSSGWTQFLATRGYAVLQPQYRGSEGWGMALWKAGDKEWGQKMSDDNDDGAAWLVAEGIADPQRMAIFGYSYGGFAAIAASVRPNSPYQMRDRRRRRRRPSDASATLGRQTASSVKSKVGPSQAWIRWTMSPTQTFRSCSITAIATRQAETRHSRDFYQRHEKRRQRCRIPRDQRHVAPTSVVAASGTARRWATSRTISPARNVSARNKQRRSIDSTRPRIVSGAVSFTPSSLRSNAGPARRARASSAFTKRFVVLRAHRACAQRAAHRGEVDHRLVERQAASANARSARSRPRGRAPCSSTA